MAKNEFLKVERDGPLTIVTINRPEVYNALHPPAHWEFDRVFTDFRDDPEQWIAIITGAGDKAFSAGNDLKYQAAGGPRHRPDSGFAGITNRYDQTKPIIAAVNGWAMGGGFETALACDLIIAAENATFALPDPRVETGRLYGARRDISRQRHPQPGRLSGLQGDGRIGRLYRRSESLRREACAELEGQVSAACSCTAGVGQHQPRSASQ